MYPHTTMYPEPGSCVAAITKHASSTPREVANMPAPHGHQDSVSFSSPKRGMHGQYFGQFVNPLVFP